MWPPGRELNLPTPLSLASSLLHCEDTACRFIPAWPFVLEALVSQHRFRAERWGVASASPPSADTLWGRVLGRAWMHLEVVVRKSLDRLEETVGENVGVKVLWVRPGMRMEMSSGRGTEDLEPGHKAASGAAAWKVGLGSEEPAV